MSNGPSTYELMRMIAELSNEDKKLIRFMFEESQKWRQDMQTIPFIQFPAEWKIQIIPPFGDAVVRFRVLLPSGCEKSIYLDSRDSLGYGGGKPYWEVYPATQGEPGRCGLNDISTLLELIADETN